MADELISVIVPVYGAQAYLNKCVDSIIGQTYENLEIILVDDGSKDRSGIMCDEYAELDKRVRVIHKTNGGLMSAWMEGAKKATGSYLCFVDSDDYVDIGMIDAMSRFIKGDNEIICCNYVIEHTDGRQVKAYHTAEPGEYTGDRLQNEIKRRVLGNENRTVTMSRCMKLTSRNLITDNMKYCDTRIKMAEDVNIMLAAILDARRIYIMEDSFFYHYYYNDESIVHHYDAGINRNMEYLFAALDKILADKCGSEYDESMLEKEMLFMFMLQLKNELRKDDSGVVHRMLELLKSHDIKKRVIKNPLVVSDSGNKLLYLLMRHPNVLTARIVSLAFEMKNRNRGK